MQKCVADWQKRVLKKHNCVEFSKKCVYRSQKRKKKIPAQCVCAGKIKGVLSGNNFGIAFDEFLSLAVANRDLIAGREDNCIIFNVMDILGVYKEALMAQDKSVTFKLLAGIFQTAAYIDSLCLGMYVQVTVVCFNESYFIREKRMD